MGSAGGGVKLRGRVKASIHTRSSSFGSSHSLTLERKEKRKVIHPSGRVLASSGCSPVLLQHPVDPVSWDAQNGLGGASEVPDAAVPRLALQPLGGAVARQAVQAVGAAVARLVVEAR